jgi:hypothetical protein
MSGCDLQKSATFEAFKREKGSMASFHGVLGLFPNAAHDTGRTLRGHHGRGFAVLDEPVGRTSFRL